MCKDIYVGLIDSSCISALKNVALKLGTTEQ